MPQVDLDGPAQRVGAHPVKLATPESCHAVVDTVIGEVTLVANAGALVGLYYPGHWTNPSRAGFGPQVDVHADAVLDLAHHQLAEYLDGRRTDFELTTRRVGDPFQQRVRALLDLIPFGRTTTYGELADELGQRSLARMVGRAVGHNPLSIVVPCHRVVGKTGSLTGYAGGLARKRFLLDLESGLAPDPSRLF